MRSKTLLATIGGMPLTSGVHAIFDVAPVYLAYSDIMGAIYHTISTHHEIFCGPTQKPVYAQQQQTVTVTKTTTIAGETITNTITPTRVTTRYVTLTHAATTDAVAPTETLEIKRDTESNCYWLAVHELAQVNGLYNLTAEDEVLALRGLISQARKSHDQLEQIAEGQPNDPEKASEARALREVLYHLVDAQVLNCCDTFLDLADKLIAHDLLSPVDKETQKQAPLFDSALRELEVNDSETLAKPAPGVLSGGAVEALSVVLNSQNRETGNIEKDARYCFGGDCEWPTHIFSMWQVTEQLRDVVLRERLRIAKDQAQKQLDDTRGVSVMGVLVDTGVMLGLYGVFRFLSKMTAGPLRA